MIIMRLIMRSQYKELADFIAFINRLNVLFERIILESVPSDKKQPRYKKGHIGPTQRLTLQKAWTKKLIKKLSYFLRNNRIFDYLLNSLMIAREASNF